MGQTFARFRWSTQADLAANTIVGHDGEVEDYPATVLGVPVLTTTKTSAIHAPTSFTDFYLPANDVIYTIATVNTGTAATDADSIFTLDSLPAQVQVFVGDFDGAGPRRERSCSPSRTAPRSASRRRPTSGFRTWRRCQRALPRVHTFLA